MNNRFKSKQQQRGAVLAVSLIILLVITILSVQGIQSTLMQEKMTSAVRDGHVALEAAEAGLVDAETFIETLVSTVDFNDTGAGGLYTKGTAPIPGKTLTDAVWGSGFIRTATAVDNVYGNSVTPQYFIEELGIIDSGEDPLDPSTTYGGSSGGGDVTGFKVVSRAAGRDANTLRVLVSYYGKRL